MVIFGNEPFLFDEIAYEFIVSNCAAILSRGTDLNENGSMGICDTETIATCIGDRKQRYVFNANADITSD